MQNSTLLLKLKLRLNKLASNDFDNIESWKIAEAFNKAQIEWVRRQLHGSNIYKEGDELSKRRIDDLQKLLVDYKLTGEHLDTYFESDNFPPLNYLEYKKVSVLVTSECCPDPRSMTVYLAEVANADLYYRDPLKRPDFEWGETYCTLQGNTVRIYTRDFTVSDATLTYYRKPRNIKFIDTIDPYTGDAVTTEVNCEFKDDIVEILIDETVSLLASDIESFNQMQLKQQSSERNN